MAQPVDYFELDYHQARIRIYPHSINGQSIYRIQFPDKRPALVITRALNAEAARFWTSIPEGRQREAEEVGTLIAAHIQQKQE